MKSFCVHHGYFSGDRCPHSDHEGEEPQAEVEVEPDTRDEEIAATYTPPSIEVEDFLGWIQTKASQEIPVGLMLAQAITAVNAMHDYADRQNRLEARKQPSAPFWISEEDARVVVKCLGGTKDPKARLLRQEIRDTFGFRS